MSLVYNGVAMLSNLDPDSDMGKAINTTIIATFAIGMLYSARHLATGDIKKGAYEVIWILTLAGFFLKGNTTVYIYDEREYSPNYGDSVKVDNVPFALAAMTSAATSLSLAFTHIMDVAMSPADDTSIGQYSKVGYGNNIKVLSDFMSVASNINPNDLNTSKATNNVVQYVKNCILTGDKDTMRYMLNPDDTYKNTFDCNNFGTCDKEFDSDTGETCEHYYNTDDEFKNDFDAIGNLGKDKFTNYEKNRSLDSDKMNDYLKPFYVDGYDAIGSVQDAASNIAISTTLIPTAVKGATTGVAGIDSSADISAAKAKMDMMVNSTGQFQWLQEMIPYFMHFLFAIMIAAYFPMVLFLAIRGYEAGSKVVINYFFGMVAFEMTNVGLAIVQNLVLFYSSQHFITNMIALGQNPLGLGMVTKLMAEQATMQGVAGVLGVIAIPFTVGIILKGETMAAASLMGGIKGMFTGDVLGTASGSLLDNQEQQLAKHETYHKSCV